MDEIVDNIAMHRFEMLIGDDIAVAYYQEQDGSVVLLHTEVPQRFSGQGVAPGAHRLRDAERARAAGDREVPVMSSYAAKHPEYLSMLDG